MSSFDPHLDHFTLFKLSPTFIIDAADLKQTYIALQQAHHPDTVDQSDDALRLQAVKNAARIEDAYNQLSDPYLRAKLLLNMEGIEWDDEQASIQDGDFLMQQLDWREQIEFAGDDEDGLDALEELLVMLQTAQASLIAEISAAFNERSYAAAQQHTLKLPFYSRISNEVKQRIEQIEDDLL